MAKGREIKLPLPAADDLFSTQEERDEAKREYVADIPLIEISDFPNHPYKVKQDESMLELAASIREKGVVNPALVRPKPEGGYEMVAGHRRKFASELAGKAVMPCIVRNLTDDEATIIMVDSNLQREKVLPSEKAFAYKMKLDAMKRQGKRSDLTSVPLAQKLQGKTSRQLLGEQVGESQDQIRRYIRLTELITPILDMVDEGKIAMRPAVELSYLPKEQQQVLLDTMEQEDCTPSHAQAIKMRKFAEAGKLNEDVILSIMTEEKPNQVEQFKIPKKRIDKYFSPGTTPKQDAENIKEQVKIFLKDKLNLTMSEEKTHVTHSSEKVRYLGYDIRISRSQDTKRTKKGLQRVWYGKVQLYMPKEKWIAKLHEYGAFKIKKDENGKEIWKPLHRGALMPLDDVAIISKYNSEIRGLYNYYRLAINVCNLGKFHSIMRGSCLKTLAAKYNSSVMKMYKKYRSVKGDFGADYKTKSGTKAV